MRVLILIVFGVLVTSLSFAQEELVNVFTSKSTTHGGTPDSGVSSTVNYFFVAKSTIELENIWYEKKPGLTLHKGDTLVIALSSYRSYHGVTHIEDYKSEGDLDIRSGSMSEFNAFMFRNKFQLNIKTEQQLAEVLQYKYKNKVYTAKVKSNIDETVEHFAP